MMNWLVTSRLRYIFSWIALLAAVGCNALAVPPKPSPGWWIAMLGQAVLSVLMLILLRRCRLDHLVQVAARQRLYLARAMRRGSP